MTSPDPSTAEIHGAKIEPTDESLWTLLSAAADQHPDNAAIISLHQSEHSRAPLRWTYAQLQHKCASLAGSLESLGHTPRDPVVTLLDNQAECGLLFWTSARLGSPFVPLSPRSLARPEELKYMLRVAGVGTLVATDDDQAAQLDEIAPEILRKVPIKIIVKCGRTTLPSSWISLAEVLANLLGIATLSTSQTRCTDTVLLLFTSGTTSTPKACPHSSRTLCLPSLAYRSLRHIDADKRSVQHLASHHVFGLTVTLAFWLAGASVVYPSKAFEPGSTLDAIENQRCTHMAAVPSMIYGLRNHPSFSKRRLKSLISIDLGGAAIHPEILRTCLDPLQFGALSASTSFGMTESTTSIAWDDTEIPPIQDDSVSVGRPTPGAKVKICAPGSRTPLKREELGELHLGGHQVINSYLCAEEGTLYEDLKDGGRWIATGDQALVDIAGAVHVLGRYKDLIIRGGSNISAASIERVLNKANGIVAHVVGIPDEVAQEVPIAVIQKTGDDHPTYEALQELASRELGVARSPKILLDLVEDLKLQQFPTTTSGKVRKVELRELALAFLQRQEAVVKEQPRTSTLDVLLGIWSQITGRPDESLPTDQPVNTFADSIMILQFSAQVKKELGRNLVLEELNDQNTIEEQAQLVSTHSKDSCVRVVPRTHRDGPPETGDMVHTLGDIARTERTREIAEPLLTQMHLSWDQHVEDVIPMTDASRFFGRPLRPQSWNLWQAFATANVDHDQLKSALKTALSRHSLLRSLVVRFDEGTELFLVVRPCKEWDQLSMIEGLEVETPEDLRTLLPNDQKHYVTALPGPLFKLKIAKVRSTGGTGFVFNGQHTAFDALSISLWVREVDSILSGGSLKCGSYKDFADAYFLHRNGPAAQAACDFHVRRLSGLGAAKEALWPPQRAPGWFRGNDEGWLHLDGTSGKAEERPILDGNDACGLSGIMRTIQIPSHPIQHRAAVRISPANFVKSACALMNVCQTGATEAVFSSVEAGRSWPFWEDWAHGEQAPIVHPLDIAGPTLERVLNRIHIDRQERVSSFLRHVQEEQKQLTKYAHAPLYTIIARLEERERIPTDLDRGDGSILDTCFRRQCFNWLPNTKSGGDLARLEQMQPGSSADLGLQWNCGSVSEETLFVHARWDDAQLRLREVQGAMDVFIKAVQWLTAPENWDKRVGEFEGLMK